MTNSLLQRDCTHKYLKMKKRCCMTHTVHFTPISRSDLSDNYNYVFVESFWCPDIYKTLYQQLCDVVLMRIKLYGFNFSNYLFLYHEVKSYTDVNPILTFWVPTCDNQLLHLETTKLLNINKYWYFTSNRNWITVKWGGISGTNLTVIENASLCLCCNTV